MVLGTNCNGTSLNSVTSIVHGTAFLEGQEETCTVPLPEVLSCQKRNLDTPEATIRGQLDSLARRELDKVGCVGGKVGYNFGTLNIGGAWEYTADEIVSRGTASNCHKHDLNDMSLQACAEMFPTQAMQHDGKPVVANHMSRKVCLYTCDARDEAMPALEDDMRKAAAHSFSVSGYTVSPESLELRNMSILPFV